MRRYIIGRCLQAVVCLIALSFIVFFVLRLTGDPASYMLSDTATQEDYDRIVAAYGFDRPLYVQYGIFLKDMFTGNFGNSLFMKRPVADILIARFPATLQLAGGAMALALVVGIPLGVYAAKKRGIVDLIARLIAALGQSLPPFWLGLMLILIFAVWLPVLPAGGRANITSMILPSVALSAWIMAGVLRITRSSMLDVLGTEYVKLARIKGLSEFVVVWKHAFRNALLPVITFAAMMGIAILAGAVVTETVFAWPGIGQLVIQSVTWRDFPLTQALVLIIAAAYIAMNLVIDIAYAYINPKIRYER